MKLKKLSIAMLLATMISGCTNSTFDKSMEAAKIALASKEYDKASGLVELALQEKSNNEEAKLLKEQIDELINIEELISLGKFEDANNLCDDLKSRDNINDIISKQIDGMTEVILTKSSEMENANFKKELARAEELVNSKKYEDAKELLDELKQDIRDTTTYMESLNKINSLLDQCEKGIKEKEANNKAASNKVTNNNNTETRQAMHIKEALEILDEKLETRMSFSFGDGADSGDKDLADFYIYYPNDAEGVYYVNKYTGEAYEQRSEGDIRKL